MVRKVTKENEKAIAQWRAAWFLLRDEWRAAIAIFCINSDSDIAEAVLKGTDFVVAD